MPNFPAVAGAGALSGNVVLAGVFSASEAFTIPHTFGVEIKFYSASGEFVGMVGTTYDNAPHLEFSLTEKKNGGLDSFKIQISREVDIPFFNGQMVRFFINGNHWWTGELQYRPEADRRNTDFEYTGAGYATHLKDIKVNKLYENKTLKFILDDLIGSSLSGTPIVWDTDRIAPPTITVTKLELNGKSVAEGINQVLKIANYDFLNAEYRYFIDKDKIFNFALISSDVQESYFEGYQYHDPDIQTDDKNITNKVNIYRSLEASKTTEFVSTVEDTDSQAKYGVREENLTIPDYFDATTAENIALAKIEEFKAPKTVATIKKITINDSPFEFGKYYTNSRRMAFTDIVSECDSLSEWDIVQDGTTITVDNTVAYTGRQCIKMVTTAASENDYIEITLPGAHNFCDHIHFSLRQNPIGMALGISIEDDEGNQVEFVLFEEDILQEDGFKLLTEDGDHIRIENVVQAIDVIYADSWIHFSYDVTGVNNIKKIRFTVLTDDVFEIRLDRIEIYREEAIKRNSLILSKIDYTMSRVSILADMTLGGETPSMVDEIKDIRDNADMVSSIFQKQ